MEFCEYCGNMLDENGRCPDADCVYNVLLDILGDETNDN